MKYESSELILNDDNSVFHLHLQPEQLADKVILVGDMGRINTISSFFDKIECEVQNREFRTVTGTYRGKRITVVATGIGTDNIDIVMTELDALANIDLINRCDKKEFRKLSFVRIGTSGGMQINVPVDSFLVSEKSIGFDGVLNYYANRDKVCDLEFEKEFVKQTGYSEKLTAPYCINSNSDLVNRIAKTDMIRGITISSPGFYGPQGRELRMKLAFPYLNKNIEAFEYKGKKVTNYEMESSAIAGLAAIMGHEAMTVCVIIANRMLKQYSKDYHPAIKNLIQIILDRI